MVDRSARRRSGGSGGPSGRRPPHPAQSDSVDGGNRAPAARVADVRRRHRGLAPRPASAGHRSSCACSRSRNRRAVDRGLRLVLLAFFVSLIVPAYHLTVSSAGEVLPASGISGAWISGILPVSLLLMSAIVVQQLYDDGAAVWRDGESVAWSLGTAGVAIVSVLIPLLAGAPPLAVLVIRISRHRGSRASARVYPRVDVSHLPHWHRRRRPDHPPHQDSRRRRFVRAARDPALHPRRRPHGVRRYLRTHRRSGDGHRR